MLRQKADLLDELMLAYPHRNANCNRLDDFVQKMHGFRLRYLEIQHALPDDKAQELKEAIDKATGVVTDVDSVSAPQAAE